MALSAIIYPPSGLTVQGLHGKISKSIKKCGLNIKLSNASQGNCVQDQANGSKLAALNATLTTSLQSPGSIAEVGVDVSPTSINPQSKQILNHDEYAAYQALLEILHQQGVGGAWEATIMRRPQTELAIWAKQKDQPLFSLQRGYHGLLDRGLVITKAKGRNSAALIHNVLVEDAQAVETMSFMRQPDGNIEIHYE